MSDEGDNILAIDFDGTIIPQGSGLSRERLEKRPMAGAVNALQMLHAQRWRIVVFSCRARDEQGRAQIINWLRRYGIDNLVEEITAQKPWAKYYIDDRAIAFDNWASVLERLTDEGQETDGNI